MTGVEDFNELLEMAKRGDRSKVDGMASNMGGLEYFHAPVDFPISAFAHLSKEREENCELNKDDIASSLFHMISRIEDQQLIGYSQAYKFNEIYFGGTLY